MGKGGGKGRVDSGKSLLLLELEERGWYGKGSMSHLLFFPRDSVVIAAVVSSSSYVQY